MYRKSAQSRIETKLTSMSPFLAASARKKLSDGAKFEVLSPDVTLPILFVSRNKRFASTTRSERLQNGGLILQLSDQAGMPVVVDLHQIATLGIQLTFEQFPSHSVLAALRADMQYLSFTSLCEIICVKSWLDRPWF